MAENDAEWIDVDKDTRKPVRPLSPIPRETTTPRNRPPPTRSTFRPRRRRPRTTVPPYIPPKDAKEIQPNNHGGNIGGSDNTVLVSSVVSSLVVVALLVGLLYYLFTLKKKLKKTVKKQKESEFALRVEDINHLELNESENIYENTADIQRLFHSMRTKNIKQPRRPPIVDVEPVTHDREPEIKFKPILGQNVGYSPSPKLRKSVSRPNIPPPKVPGKNLKGNADQPLKAARVAPPPPVKNEEVDSSASSAIKPAISSWRSAVTPKTSPIPANRSLLSSPSLHARGRNPPSPSSPFSTENFASSSAPAAPPASSKPKSPFISPKPVVPLKPQNASQPKKNSATASKKASFLPPLKMNLLPFQKQISNSQFSTPETADSYLDDNDENFESEKDPELLSVGRKKALIEALMKSNSSDHIPD